MGNFSSVIVIGVRFVAELFHSSRYMLAFVVVAPFTFLGFSPFFLSFFIFHEHVTKLFIFFFSLADDGVYQMQPRK